MSLQAL